MSAVPTRCGEDVVIAAQPSTHHGQPIGWSERAETRQQALTARCDVPEDVRARRLRGAQRHVVATLADSEADRYELAAVAAQLNQRTEHTFDSHLDDPHLVDTGHRRVVALHGDARAEDEDRGEPGCYSWGWI